MNRREYLKHFMLLFSGTAAAQVANLLSYPVLARLYDPREFGLFALFVAISAIPGAIACGRFDLAVPTAPHFGRFAILWLCLTMSAAMGVICGLIGLVYWLFLAPVSSLLMPLLLGACVALTGFCTAATLYLLRHDQYRISSTSIVARTGFTVALQIGLGLAGPTALSLIVGFMLGLAAQAILLGVTIWTQVSPGVPRPRHMIAMFRRFRRQVAIDIPSTLIAALSLNVMTLAISSLYGQAILGLYAIGQRIAGVPLQLFNDALGQIFFQKAAQAQRERGDFWTEMRFNLLVSAALSLAILAAIWFFARPFIVLFLGREWEGAADILLIQAPMLAMRSLCMSIATAVFVLGRASWLFLHNVANALILGLAFLVGLVADLDLNSFLAFASAFLTIEYAGFAAVLAWAARRRALGAAAQAV